MENGVEALKIASAVLIFVLAIAITISAFTTAMQAMRRIFDIQNADEYVTDAEGKYLNMVAFDAFDGGTRTVGLETIISSIYRAEKENYAVLFLEKDGKQLDFKVSIKNEDGTETEEIQISGFDFAADESDNPIKSISENIQKGNSDYIRKCLKSGLYKELADIYSGNQTFIERLGEYYMNDLGGENGIAEVNKIKKRIIVYQIKETND